MNIVLAGHEGSKKILAASSALIDKYVPQEFDIHFLNFGAYDGTLIRGEYVQLDTVQQGGASQWSAYIARYLESLPDKFIVFALDDYLMSGEVNLAIYHHILNHMENRKVICGRLCGSSFYPAGQRRMLCKDVFALKHTVEYSATTQYCIWRRKELIELLKATTDPWDFEINGSKMLNQSKYKVVATEDPAFHYPESSSLSTRWGEKIKMVENKTKDIKWLVSAGYIIDEQILKA